MEMLLLRMETPSFPQLLTRLPLERVKPEQVELLILRATAIFPSQAKPLVSLEVDERLKELIR